MLCKKCVKKIILNSMVYGISGVHTDLKKTED